MIYNKQKSNLLTRALLNDHLPFILCNKQRTNKKGIHTHTHTHITMLKDFKQKHSMAIILQNKTNKSNQIMHFINLAATVSLKALTFAYIS